MFKITKAKLSSILVTAFTLMVGIANTNIALAASTPMTPACLGGTLVKSGNYSEGTLRIYKSCGAYYAQFGTKGGKRSFWIDIINLNASEYWSMKKFTNTYGGWTDLIPGACVGATVKVTNLTAKTIYYGC